VLDVLRLTLSVRPRIDSVSQKFFFYLSCSVAAALCALTSGDCHDGLPVRQGRAALTSDTALPLVLQCLICASRLLVSAGHTYVKHAMGLDVLQCDQARVYDVRAMIFSALLNSCLTDKG
jgi:hypothetical protein